MPKAFRNIIFTTIIYFIDFSLMAQCPDSNFSINQEDICQNESLVINNNSTLNVNYSWDFCAGDNWNRLPVFELMEDNFVSNLHSRTVKNNGEYFSLVPGWTSNKLFLLEYGNSILNTPVKTEIVDLNIPLINPAGIDILEENGDWYSIITGYNSNKLYLLKFGSSLNSTPTVFDISNSLNLNLAMDVKIITDKGGIFVFVINNADSTYPLLRLNFGNSILNTPTVDEITIPGSSQLSTISFGRSCDQWYGFIVSRATREIFRMDFGDSPSNNPAISEVGGPSGLLFNDPGGIDVVSEANKNYVFVTSRNGPLYRLDFGDSFLNNPTGLDLGNINSTTRNWGIEFIKESSDWHALLSNFSGELYRYSFEGNCSANKPISSKFEPVEVSYSETGTYIVSLESIDSNGDIDVHTDTVNVIDLVAPPAIINTEDFFCELSNLNFFGESNEPITDWQWNFGDGNTAVGQNVNHQYADSGVYDVVLEIAADNGCSNFARKQIPIYLPPESSFDYPTGILCSNDPITFSNTTIFYGPDSIITYNWNFNEEALISFRDTSYNFSSGGDKNITLTASIPGCISEASEIISIAPGPLTAFSSEGTCEYDVFQFTNSTTGDDITGYLWDFGDGYSSTNLSPTHHYASGGTYPVSLTASNALGCQTTLQQVVPVRYIPSPKFTNDLACSDNSVKFYDQSTVPEANITEQFWTLTHNSSDFQASQTGPSPSFQLGEAGTYALELIAKSNYGCTDTLVRDDVTVKPSPIADFSYQETCLGDSTLFMEQAEFPDSTELNSAEWLIDGKLYSGPDVKHQFTLPDEYEIEMFLRSSNFCTDHITKTIQILPLPDLDIALSALCAEQPVSINALVNSPLDPVTSYHWEIDNTPISNRESFIYEFDDAQNYLINLAVLTENDCFNSLAQNLTIHPSPVSEFELFPSIGASPLEVSFTDLSFGASRVTYDFSDFNDDISHELNPVYTYMELGKDWPKQIAENEFGCADTSYSEIEVVIPVYDLAITDTRIEVMDQKLSMIVELTNNGTIIVNNPDLHIDIDKTITLNHKLEGRLMREMCSLSQLILMSF
jgi:PKD repeat protein